MRKAFDQAGISRSKEKGGMVPSHRLRDTFAVEFLNAGGLIQGKLLRHSTITTTEKHYGPWVRTRKEKLLQTVEDLMGKQEQVGAESVGVGVIQ
jgi:integrase